mmetsp:Transcript_10625/g.22854  ORF Transcript_10625/g.22854 Transcript_10625/m.22854 type:complete len:168 (+) Transcript_10625:155-658(+)
MSHTGLSALSCPSLKQRPTPFILVWVNEGERTVAIRCDRGWLSCCRRRTRYSSAASAGYEHDIGEQGREVFTVVEEDDHTYRFHAHNNLYLNYNESTYVVEFNSSQGRNADGTIQGRWTLFLENELDRVGMKSGAMRVIRHYTVRPLGFLMMGVAPSVGRMILMGYE